MNTNTPDNKLQVVSPLYLLRSSAACWKCGVTQEVVGLAARGIIENDPDGEDLGADADEPVTLDHIQEMPAAVLQHILKVHPAFEKRTSKTADAAYYMNVCQCGAHFGDHFLHSEPGGAFFPENDDEAARITIEELPFTGQLRFNCSYGMGNAHFIVEHGQKLP